MTTQEIFAYRLRNIRTINNHTQEYVGRILGIAGATVCYIEQSAYRTTHQPLAHFINCLVDHYGIVVKNTDESKQYPITRSYFTDAPVDDVRDLLQNPYLDFWVWSGQMTYEKAKELEKTLPKII